MNVQPQMRVTVDEYLAWAQQHPGRYELHQGVVYAMSPEGVGHAKVKGAVYIALRDAIRARKLNCHPLPDGITIRVGPRTAYEPDALVYCGEEVAPTSLEVSNPVILVEVLSPSTRHIDTAAKMGGYFKLPSVVHYLVIDPTQPLILHHKRVSDETILTHVFHDGVISLDPPGIELAVADIYAS